MKLKLSWQEQIFYSKQHPNSMFKKTHVRKYGVTTMPVKFQVTALLSLYIDHKVSGIIAYFYRSLCPIDCLALWRQRLFLISLTISDFFKSVWCCHLGTFSIKTSLTFSNSLISVMILVHCFILIIIWGYRVASNFPMASLLCGI